MDQLRAEAAVLLADPLAALKLIGAGTRASAARPETPARPRAVVYVHVRARHRCCGRGVARAEELGALTRRQLIDLLGHHQVSLRPVIDLDDGMAADCYEIPGAIDERLQLTKPADVFPFATSLSRKLDRDHTRAYVANGPPGQTAESNLGKLLRHHHRIKTHGGWQVDQAIATVHLDHAPRADLCHRRSGNPPNWSDIEARVPDLFWSDAA